MSLGAERKGGDPQLPVDVRSILSQWYGSEAIYVDTLQNGIGKLTIRAEHCSQPVIDFDNVDMLSSAHVRSVLAVKPEHMPGHFAHNLGLVLPGHQRLRIAKETLKAATGRDIRIQFFNSARFSGTVFPGDLLTTDIEVDEADDNGISARVVSTIGNNKEVMTIEGLFAIYNPNPQIPRIEESQIAEALIQSAGVSALTTTGNQSKRQVIPVFIEMGKAHFPTKDFSERETISFASQSIPQHKDSRIKADGVLLHNGRSVGAINAMHAIMMPTSMIFGKK